MMGRGFTGVITDQYHYECPYLGASESVSENCPFVISNEA
jgi:hypothetical protein